MSVLRTAIVHRAALTHNNYNNKSASQCEADFVFVYLFGINVRDDPRAVYYFSVIFAGKRDALG